MSKDNKYIAQYRQLAKKNNLKFIVEGPLLPKEPVLAIVNKQPEKKDFKAFSGFETLTLVSQEKFAKERNIIWTDKVVSSNPRNKRFLESMESNASTMINETFKCKKALLETDYGLATINLTPIKKGAPVITYEGELIIHENMKEKTPGCYFQAGPENEILIQDCSLTLHYDNFTKELVSIAAKKYKGFGVFMQSLVDADQLNYYQVPKDYYHKIALVNLSTSKAQPYPIWSACEDIPPLSLLGYNYGLEYFRASKIAFVPFNKDNGCSLPYEVGSYNIAITDSAKDEELSTTLTRDYTLKDISSIIETISNNGAIHFSSVYLIDTERKQIQEYVSKKITHFSLNILYTPDILPIKQAALYSCKQFPVEPFLTFNDPLAVKRYVHNLTIFIDTFKRIEKLSKKHTNKTLDFTNSELPVWFGYLFKQSLYIASIHTLLLTLQQCIEDKATPEEKIKGMISKYKCGTKEKFPSQHYPVTFRNAAANLNVVDLLFLLRNNDAIKYINYCAGSSKKTALHVAVESKKGQNKLATCLLLLECKADPNLKDSQEKTALELADKLSNNQELTFIFNRRQVDYSQHEVVVQIKAEAAKQGFEKAFNSSS